MDMVLSDPDRGTFIEPSRRLSANIGPLLQHLRSTRLRGTLRDHRSLCTMCAVLKGNAAGRYALTSKTYTSCWNLGSRRAQ